MPAGELLESSRVDESEFVAVWEHRLVVERGEPFPKEVAHPLHVVDERLCLDRFSYGLADDPVHFHEFLPTLADGPHEVGDQFLVWSGLGLHILYELLKTDHFILPFGLCSQISGFFGLDWISVFGFSASRRRG